MFYFLTQLRLDKLFVRTIAVLFGNPQIEPISEEVSKFAAQLATLNIRIKEHTIKKIFSHQEIQILETYIYLRPDKKITAFKIQELINKRINWIMN